MTKSSEHFPTTVDEYLATVPNDVHKVLQKLRHTIKSIVPEAEERIAYRIPIDSPTGLASWIVEKFRSWSDCDGSVEKRFTKGVLLTNITLYWITETINAASRLYYEAAHDHNYIHPKRHERTDVRTAFAIFPKDILTAPRQWAER